MSILSSRPAGYVAGALCAGLLLAGCSTSENDSSTEADSVTVSDQWVKAAPSGMTGAFAELSNSGADDVQIVSVTSPASARVEMHEMVAGPDGTMVMREKEGGVTLPAESTHSFAPGADHFMLMDLAGPLTPGSTTAFTLTFADGSTTTFDAHVRDFAGNKENYVPSGSSEGAATTTAPGHGG
ncbi:MAG: copper chaperone PCu(A)C [Rhodococcus sp. (in: high G+C Gram-positive bacteria)]|uniref:copper chaperone PCu(A)C n=1 Tax=Rhodococcus sp. TaxID=1831 RepID=UPI003BB1C7CF